MAGLAPAHWIAKVCLPFSTATGKAVSRPDRFATSRDAALAGIRTGLGLPVFVLAGAYVGFGSLCRESGFSLWLGLTSTATGWALPGQLALIELYSAGASLLVIMVAVAMSNARLLPMTVTLLPLLRRPLTPRWHYYLAAHFVAMTGWAILMQRGPAMPRPTRLPFFLGLALTFYTVTLLATAVGFFLSGLLPEAVSLGLVFINPLYFMLLFIADLKRRARALALVFGAVAGPLIHSLAPDWGLLISGLIAGTAAFMVNRALPRSPAEGHVAPAPAEARDEVEAQ
jgi:predicted branched-subunit amino acid permease